MFSFLIRKLPNYVALPKVAVGEYCFNRLLRARNEGEVTSKLILVVEGELIMTKRLHGGDTSRTKQFKDWSMRQALNSAVRGGERRSQRSLKVTQSGPERRATGQTTK
eukprot:8719540-Pyramimonas_sp.AAC.1